MSGIIIFDDQIIIENDLPTIPRKKLHLINTNEKELKNWLIGFMESRILFFNYIERKTFLIPKSKEYSSTKFFYKKF
jgi:hypothetical protein